MFRKWGNNPEPDEHAPWLSHWTLCFLLNANVAFHALVWVAFVMLMTRKGSMCMRKKFDDHADAPTSESVWTPRFLFVSGTGFHLGIISGSYGTWVIVDIVLGMPFPLAPLLCLLLVNVGLCCITIKCFDWGYEPSTGDDDDEREEDQEDSFFI